MIQWQNHGSIFQYPGCNSPGNDMIKVEPLIVRIDKVGSPELFADFTCDSLMEDESVEHLVPLVGWAGARDSLAFGYNHGWQNSFMNYKKWREFINSY